MVQAKGSRRQCFIKNAQGMGTVGAKNEQVAGANERKKASDLNSSLDVVAIILSPRSFLFPKV